MAMAGNETETDTDMDLMLSCLEETSEDVIIQALQTISAMCNNPNTQNLFHQKGGVNRIWSLLKRTKQPLITQCALFSLGCAVERNVSSQMALCKPEFFQLLTATLCDPRESLTVKCTSAFLANVLVCHNSTGQRLARDTTLLKAMMDIFRSLCDQKASLSDIHSASFNLLASVCTALSAAVNNPENVDNQRRCCSLFPAIAGVIPWLTTAKHLSPVLGFLDACATSNFMNQERVRVVGVLTALVKRLQRTEPSDGEEGQDIFSSVLLVDALVHCSNINKNNQERLVELEVVLALVHLLGRIEEASQLLKVVTCLQLLTAENTDAQHQLQVQGGIAPLIRVMAESQESDLKQVTVLVLQSCLGERPSTVTDLPEADMAIQRLQCLLDKLDSFERSSHTEHLRKEAGGSTEERTCRNLKQGDATLTQSVATLNKRAAILKQSGINVRQKNVFSSQSDAIQQKSDATLRQSSASSQSEPTSCESSPEVPHNTQPNQQGAVTAFSRPGSRTQDVISTTAGGTRPEAASGVPPMSVGSEQLQQITSSLQQIHSDLQILEQMHRTSQVSVQTKLKSLEGNLKSLESKQASCIPQPSSVTDNHLPLTIKPTNASLLAKSSLNTMPPPKTLPQTKPTHRRPNSVGSYKSQSAGQPQQHQAGVGSRKSVDGKGRQGCCAMCAATSPGVPEFTSRSLLKAVYNSSFSCPIHEEFAKWAFTTKQQRNVLSSRNSGGPATSTTSLQHPPAPVTSTPETPHSLPNSASTVRQGSVLHELALNESYIIHKANMHRAMSSPEESRPLTKPAVWSSHAFTSAASRTNPNPSSSTALRRSVLSSPPGSSRSAGAPVCAPLRGDGQSSQRAGTRVVSTNVGRHSRNFKHTPSRKGKLRDVYDFDSPPGAENRLPLRCQGYIRASKMQECQPRLVTRKHRTPFTLDEEDYVMQGVAKFGKRWRHVLISYPFNSCRTVVDLKDKYRNLRARGIAPSSR